MNRFYLQLIATLLFAGCTPGDDGTNLSSVSDDITEDEVTQVVDTWLELWATYELDMLDKVFYQSENLTYFSSEKEGSIKGFEELIAHHVGFGFVEGGMEPQKSLWLEDVEIRLHGASAVVGTIWYFGDKTAEKESVQHGPVTFVLIKNEMGDARIIHTHFANY